MRRYRLAVFLCTTLYWVAVAPSVAAQEESLLNGRVEDAVTLQPLPGVRITTADSAYSTTTTPAGTFALRVSVGQPLSVYVDLPGYLIQRFDLPSEALSRPTILRVEPEPLQLAGVTGTTERVRWSAALANSGFYNRERVGIGTHLNRTDLDRQNLFLTSQIFTRIAGVRSLGNNRNGDPVYTISRCGAHSPPPDRQVIEEHPTFVGPDVYVDGIPWNGRLDDLSVDWIEAVEVYRGASGAPAQYTRTMNSCGVVLIWTRR
jgi:hypothetical protein